MKIAVLIDDTPIVCLFTKQSKANYCRLFVLLPCKIEDGCQI